jgi:hypothetical protein
MLIKPSRKSIRVFVKAFRGIIRDLHSLTAAQLIARLNPRIQGWANYHRHFVSNQVFVQVDDAIFRALWQWARRRHHTKTSDRVMLQVFWTTLKSFVVVLRHDKQARFRAENGLDLPCCVCADSETH